MRRVINAEALTTRADGTQIPNDQDATEILGTGDQQSETCGYCGARGRWEVWRHVCGKCRALGAQSYFEGCNQCGGSDAAHGRLETHKQRDHS